MDNKDIKLSELPEEVTEDGLKMYGPTSYETQVAVLSHYLHTLDDKHDIASSEKRYEILEAIRDYIDYKHQQDKKNPKWENVSDDEVTMAAESPLECDLFRISSTCRSLLPRTPSLLSLICLLVWVASVWLCRLKEVNVYSLRNGMPIHRKRISLILATCPLAT